MTLAHWAGQFPDRPAIVSQHGDRSFAELNAHANQLARALRRRGLASGDGVAILCANRAEFAEVVAATQRAGLRLTPVNWHLTAAEAGYIVDDCEARAFVADARFAGIAAEVAELAPSAEIRLAVGGPIAGFDSYDEVLAPESGDDVADPLLGSSMLYTSGTTGRPKGVYRRDTPPTSAAALDLYGYRPGEDVHLCTGPLYHAAPLAFSLAAPLHAGVGVVLMDGWEPEAMLRLVEDHRITHTHLVPIMFHRLLAVPHDTRRKYNVSSVRMVIHGAAPCPVLVKHGMIDWFGPVLFEYYAATEGLGTFVDSTAWLARPGTVGRPVGDAVVVRDDDGAPTAPGEVGTVFLKAPPTGRFEYFKAAEKTASAYSDDYFTLGDMGYVDEDGWLFLTDRTANLIISGGVNVYPAEIDAVLLTHPAVGDAATIGVPHAEWGEEVKAVIELKRDVAPSPELAAELLALCRRELAGYKCPRTVDFVDHLPREDNGKIYKRKLRDQYREGTLH
ncbi:MAG: long-chain acyl-CoA synthetase [Actinomycetota bacterium]|jgi:long-chain acyl-CoA synthetase